MSLTKMSYPELFTRTERTSGYFSTLQTYVNLLPCFKLGRAVHPSEPVAPEYSEFLEISSRRRIRIIHIKPEKVIKENANRRSFRLSTEEYWFTRWNRPMRNVACNCSFRRSQRFSKYSLASFRQNATNDSCSNKKKKVNEGILVVENYADKLICDILVAAFKEYTVNTEQQRINDYQSDLCNKNEGIDNLAYKTHETDEVDNHAILTKDIHYLFKNGNSNKFSKDYQSVRVQNNVSEEVTLRTKTKTDKTDRKKCTHLHSDKKKKPVVLFLHGIGSSAEIWWDVLQCLVCAGYEVLAPDMLGHGYSSVPNCAKAYTFTNLLKDTLSIFDKYISSTESDQCIIIGHSFGCSLATALARYREQRVLQLVLISGGGPTPLAPPVSSTEVSDFSCMRCFMQPLLFCGIKRTMFYSSRGKHFETCENASAVPSYVLQYISEGQNWPEGDAAFHRRILIPTLLVHGLQDTFVTLVQECEMERTIPRSFLEVIPTAGHLSMVDTPEQLCHMLLCFFQWWAK